MTKTLKAFHLLNGAIVVGEYLKSDGDVVTINNPLNLLVQQTPKGISMGFAPMGFPFYEKATEQPKLFEVTKAAIAYHHELDAVKHKDIISNYNQMFSNIILGAGVNLNLGK